ncbi:MAG: IS1 family transposase [Hyphomicrobiaceae bacterium]
MNKLPLSKRVQILAMLCEGSSMRSISRVCDVSINTVTKMLADAGNAALIMHDEMVRKVPATRIQCDEIWSFNYCKEKNVGTAKSAPDRAGDLWTWTALESQSKLIVSYLVGDRSGQAASRLMDDLKMRLANRVQLTTDGHKAYLEAVEGAFGNDVDYAMLVKLYGNAPSGPETRYSPAECIGARKTRITGEPDEKYVSTSHVERSNLSMRMHMRRFTRLTNAHSKRITAHIHMVALYTVFYNFIRVHKTLRMSPAMAAGIAPSLMTFEDVVAKMDAIAPKPGRPKTYKKRIPAAD